MIRSFADQETQLIWIGHRSRKLPPDIQQAVRRKLTQLEASERPADMRIPRGNRFEELKGKRKEHIVCGLTTSGGLPSAGLMETRTMSISRTIIPDDERLDNVHPGDILREDFLIGTEIPMGEVAEGAGIDAKVLAEIIASKRDIDAAIDARLTRYFGMSEGFFLRLQNCFDIEEVRRKHGAELDRIVPRAA